MPDFTPPEREALSRCHLAVFEDRIIYQARPPIDDTTLARIARRCAGPIPDGLVSLWREAFGGRGLFRQLSLESDPADDEGSTGAELREHIDELAGHGAAGESARSKLDELVRGAVLCWRGAVADGTIARSQRLRHLALEAAARSDDLALLEKLVRLGCPVDERLGGGGSLIDHALAQNAMAVARALLDRNVPVTDGIRNAAPHASPELIRELLARGAEPDATAALAAVDGGQVDSALAIADALIASEPSIGRELREDALERARAEEATADRVESGAMGSNLTPAEYRAGAARFRAFADRLPG